MEETETTAKKRRRCTYNKDWEDIYPWAAADGGGLGVERVSHIVPHKHTPCPTFGLLGPGHPSYEVIKCLSYIKQYYLYCVSLFPTVSITYQTLQKKLGCVISEKNGQASQCCCLSVRHNVGCLRSTQWKHTNISISLVP